MDQRGCSVARAVRNSSSRLGNQIKRTEVRSRGGGGPARSSTRRSSASGAPKTDGGVENPSTITAGACVVPASKPPGTRSVGREGDEKSQQAADQRPAQRAAVSSAQCDAISGANSASNAVKTIAAATWGRCFLVALIGRVSRFTGTPIPAIRLAQGFRRWTLGLRRSVRVATVLFLQMCQTGHFFPRG